jgi:hypothetical protein
MTDLLVIRVLSEMADTGSDTEGNLVAMVR